MDQEKKGPVKLDYTLKTAKERVEFVAQLPKEQLKSKKYIEILADYIISAMTKEEREHPEILKNSRKTRIAKGSGKTNADVNKVIKKYDQMKMMMNRMKSAGGMNAFKNMKF